MNREKGIGAIDILIIIALIIIAGVLAVQRSEFVQGPLKVQKDRQNLRALEYAEILYEIAHMNDMVAGEEEVGEEGEAEDELLDDEPLEDMGDAAAVEAPPILSPRILADLSPYMKDWEQVISPFDGSQYSLMVKEFGYEIRSTASDEFIDSGVYSWEQTEEEVPSAPLAPAQSAAPVEADPTAEEAPAEAPAEDITQS